MIYDDLYNAIENLNEQIKLKNLQGLLIAIPYCKHILDAVNTMAWGFMGYAGKAYPDYYYEVGKLKLKINNDFEKIYLEIFKKLLAEYINCTKKHRHIK